MKGHVQPLSDKHVFADLTLGVLLVVIRCFRSDSSAIFDSPDVQVRPVIMTQTPSDALVNYCPVPMHSVFRRSTTLIVVVGEYFMFRKLPSKSCMVSHNVYPPSRASCKIAVLCFTMPCAPDQTVTSLLQGAIFIMLAGALIAGATDLTYSLPGYIWVTICAISTAMYLLLIRALKDSTGVLLHVAP